MKRILTAFKASKADVVTLEKPIIHLFEDLISKMLLILFSIELNKFDLELLPSMREIFHKIKMTPLSRKRKEPSTPQPTPYLGKERQ